jgi:hypothetical protein
MKCALSLAVVFAALVAAPVLADDGNVPQPTLNVLGLAGMETLSDAEGMHVRGLSGNAHTQGLSLVTGLLIDPATKSYVFGTDTNYAHADAENAGCMVFTWAEHEQASGVALSLDVTTLTSDFSGILLGAAGGFGYAASQ